MDSAHKYTDKKIEDTESQINKVYNKLEKDLIKMSNDYFEQFSDVDAEKQKEVESGDITEKEYRSWRASTMMSGLKWSNFSKAVSKRIYEANKQATDIFNSVLPDVFVENYNHIGKDIQRQVREIR